MVKKKKAEVTKRCVACGCCVKICPRNALSIYNGLYAKVDVQRCVGCAKCVDECPASVISIILKEDVMSETKTLA